MRLAWLTAGIALWVFGVAVAAERITVVATQTIDPAPYDLSLPEKVGLLEAGEHRDLAFEVSGRLASRAADGASVAAGEVVAELDTALERVRLRQAKLRLREARSELRRTEGLRASRVASEKVLESAQTDVDLRAAERDAANEQLARRILVAPFDGVVAETRFDPGEVVSPGRPVVLFMDLQELRLELGVPGYQIGRVHEGASVLVTLPARPGERFEGRVRRVAPAASEGRHLFEVEVRIANPEQRMRAGMSAHARIVTDSLASALALPLVATVERNGERVVFFVEAGRAKSVSVAGATTHGDRLVLLSPPPYRVLVVRGQRDLSDGMAVRVDNTVLAGAETP